MTVRTGGRIRGLLSRWLMRLEAAGSVLRMGFLGVTAASTLTSALSLLGYEGLAPAVLVGGLVGTVGFAWGYVELGLYNRKNRERIDRGDNFIAASGAIQHYTNARVWARAVAEATGADPEVVIEATEDELAASLSEFRDGVDVEQMFRPESNGHEMEARS